jgi:hypothetical protein
MAWLLPAQVELVNQVKLALEEVRSGHESRGIRFQGPSGSGKSYGLDRVCDLFAGTGTSGARQTPVVRIDTKSASTPEALMRAILGALGRPIEKRLPSGQLEWMVHDALDAQRTEVLILEEFHNSIAKTTSRFREGNQQLLKGLWNRSPSSSTTAWSTPGERPERSRLLVVVSGVDTLDEAFEADAELRSRFPCVVRIAHLRMNPSSEFRTFRKLVAEQAEGLGVGNLVEVNDDLWIARLYFATGAHLRQVASLLARAKTLHRREPDLTREAVFMQACASIRSAPVAHPNPFELSEDQLLKLVERALRTGPNGHVAAK